MNKDFKGSGMEASTDEGLMRLLDELRGSLELVIQGHPDSVDKLMKACATAGLDWKWKISHGFPVLCIFRC